MNPDSYQVVARPFSNHEYTNAADETSFPDDAAWDHGVLQNVQTTLNKTRMERRGILNDIQIYNEPGIPLSPSQHEIEREEAARTEMAEELNGNLITSSPMSDTMITTYRPPPIGIGSDGGIWDSLLTNEQIDFMAQGDKRQRSTTENIEEMAEVKYARTQHSLGIPKTRGWK